MIPRAEIELINVRPLDKGMVWLGVVSLCAGFTGLRLLMPYVAPLRFDFSLEGPANVLYLQAAASLAFGLGTALLALQEIRRGLITRWLTATLKGGWQKWVFLIGFFFALSSIFLLPGNPLASDGVGRVHITLILKRYLTSGLLPVYSMTSWMGFPLLHAGTRLYEFSIAFVDLLFNDILFSTKLMLMVYNLCAGLSFYASLREIKTSPISSLAGATAYTLSAFRYSYQMDNGREPLSLFYALLPLCFLAANRLIQHWRIKDAALLALVSGALMWTHLTFGAAGIGFVLLYTVVRYGLDLGLSRETVFQVRQIGMLGLGFGGAFAVTALFIIPMLSDGAYLAQIFQVSSLPFSLGYAALEGVVQVQPETNQLLNNTGYLSNVVLILTGLALGVGVYRRSPTMLAYGVIAVTAGFLALGHIFPFYTSLLDLLPFGSVIYIVKSSGYYLIYLMVGGICAAALLIDQLAEQGEHLPGWLRQAALGVAVLGSLVVFGSLLENRIKQLYLPIYATLLILPLSAIINRRRWLKYSALSTIVLSLIFADLLPVQLLKLSYVQESLFLPNTDNLYEELRVQPGDRPTRTVDLRPGYLVRYDVPLNGGAPCLYCGSDELAPHTLSLITRASQAQMVEELQQTNSLSPGELTFLYATNTAHLVTSEKATGEVRIIDLVHSPIVASTEAALMQGDDFVAQLDDWDINFATAQADKIYVLEELPRMRSGQADLQIEVVEHHESLTDADITFTLSNPAFVQLTYSYFPFLSVTDGGEEIEFTETSLGMIGFWAEAGTHEIHIQRGYTIAHIGSAILSLITLITATGLVVYDPVRQTIQGRRDPDE